MTHFIPTSAPIQVVQQAIGEALSDAIEKQGGKVAFAKRAGLNRATLYRLLRGENVSTEVLLRTLRELGRTDLITLLAAPPLPSPLELRPAQPKTRRDVASDVERHHSVPRAKARSLVSQLQLGRPPRETDDA